MNTPTHTDDTVTLPNYPVQITVYDMIHALFVTARRDILTKLLSLTQTNNDMLVFEPQSDMSAGEIFYIRHEASDTSRTVIAKLFPENYLYKRATRVLYKNDIAAKLLQFPQSECFDLIKTFLQLHETDTKIYCAKARMLAREYALQTGKESL